MAETIGRQRELTRARSRLSETVPGGVVFVGAAGIGKSTLLAATTQYAAGLGWQVIQSRAAPSERDLPFVGLHDLIGGALDNLATSLPSPLRRALDVVLLRADPPQGGVEALAVNVATVEVLQAIAARGKLLLVIDDLQWLDAPTRSVLEYALRRLPASHVAVLAASRDSASETVGLVPEPLELIEVSAMGEPELADLVTLRTGWVPSPQRAAQLHQLSGGNPFLALELARGQGGPEWDPEQISVPDRYRRLLAERLAELSPAARQAVLAASLLSRPTVTLLRSCAGASGLAEAEAAGILRVGRTGRTGAVELDHPLLAAACRDSTGPVAVREMHAQLGLLADDPVEHAHHLALATTEVDAATAEQVETAARLAASRTAIATAAGLARDALRLTPTDAHEDLARRAVLSSAWFVQCGEQAEAQAVVGPLAQTLPPGPLRARCLLALADALGQEVGQGMTLQREALRQPGGDPGLVLEARMALANSLAVYGDLVAARAEAAAAQEAASAAGSTEGVAAAKLWQAEIDVYLGVPLDRSPAWTGDRAGVPAGRIYEHPDRIVAFSAAWRDHLGEAATLLDGLLRRAQERGDLSSEGALSMHRAEVALRAGQLEKAAACAHRCYRLGADGIRDQLRLYIRAHVEAWRGELDGARGLATTGLAMADEAADAIFGAQCLLVLGFTEVSAGRFDEAARHESRLRDLLARMQWGHPGALRWHGDAVEAFVATGRLDEAADVSARLWREADRLDLSGSRAVAARCDGLLQAQSGDLKRAEASLLDSLALMSGLDMPLERARTLLALGVTRRRSRQRATAIAALSAAGDIFRQAGAAAWAGRVETELQRAAGGHAGQDLTVGERSVAGLAAAGRTNREISDNLYLSPKTVEAVLTRVYRKLGVRSRTELARRLEAD